MTITRQNYRDTFSEHAAVSNDDIDFAIERANSEVGDEFLGSRADLARKYFAAHLVQCDFVERSGDPTETGAVSSKTADGFSVSFAVSAPSSSAKDDFNATKYGQRYLYLVTRACGFVDL